MKFLALIAVAVGFSLSGCTDASRAQISALGTGGSITCYSGGVVIYTGEATGRIASESQSDGWFLKEKSTGNLIRVSGDCVIRN